MTARERAEESVAIACIARADEAVEHGPVMPSLVNCDSPLVWDQVNRRSTPNSIANGGFLSSTDTWRWAPMCGKGILLFAAIKRTLCDPLVDFQVSGTER